MLTMRKISVAKILFLTAGGLLIIAFLHYNLPRTAVVTIQGTDVKRTEKPTTLTTGQKAGTVRDVRFVNTMTRDNRALVLRNEDTGWGWPPYFKFNSSDLVAVAQAFANQVPPPAVLITFYGWRIQLFSLYPNILRMRAVAPDYSHFPWFNIIFLALLIGAAVFIRFKVKQLYQRIRDRFFPSKTPADGTTSKD
jgi:hypothetical protein